MTLFNRLTSQDGRVICTCLNVLSKTVEESKSLRSLYLYIFRKQNKPKYAAVINFTLLLYRHITCLWLRMLSFLGQADVSLRWTLQSSWKETLFLSLAANEASLLSQTYMGIQRFSTVRGLVASSFRLTNEVMHWSTYGNRRSGSAVTRLRGRRQDAAIRDTPAASLPGEKMSRERSQRAREQTRGRKNKSNGTAFYDKKHHVANVQLETTLHTQKSSTFALLIPIWGKT